MAKKETDKEKVQRRIKNLSTWQKCELKDLMVKLIREERAKCTKEHKKELEELTRERDYYWDKNNDQYDRFDMSKYKEGSRHGYSEND